MLIEHFRGEKYLLTVNKIIALFAKIMLTKISPI